MLTVHNLAKTYKLLPSQVLASASTFDLYVLDVGTRYIKYQYDESERQRLGLPKLPKRKELSVETLQEMINRVRSEKK